jgi:hypothetical protein
MKEVRAVARNSVVGTWRLVSYEASTVDNRRRYPFGAHPRGYLVYTPDGWMSVAVMPARRGQSAEETDAVAEPFRLRSWLSGRRLKRLARYVLSATRYISYGGRYTITGNKIIVHVEASQTPALLDKDVERIFEFQGDRLVLTAEMAGGHQRLVWEQAAAHTAHALAVHQVRTG